MLRRPRRLPPHEKGAPGCHVPGRGFLTWDELHDLAVHLTALFDELPREQQDLYRETGRLE